MRLCVCGGERDDDQEMQGDRALWRCLHRIGPSPGEKKSRRPIALAGVFSPPPRRNRRRLFFSHHSHPKCLLAACRSRLTRAAWVDPPSKTKTGDARPDKKSVGGTERSHLWDKRTKAELLTIDPRTARVLVSPVVGSNPADATPCSDRPTPVIVDSDRSVIERAASDDILLANGSGLSHEIRI